MSLFGKVIDNYIKEKDTIIYNNEIEIEKINSKQQEQIYDLQRRIKNYHRQNMEVTSNNVNNLDKLTMAEERENNLKDKISLLQLELNKERAKNFKLQKDLETYNDNPHSFMLDIDYEKRLNISNE